MKKNNASKVIVATLILATNLNGCNLIAAHNFHSLQDTLLKGDYILHKFQQPIGKENYSLVKQNDSLKLHSDFKFNDRGKDVPLQTTLTVNPLGLPVYFKTKGATSRSSVIDTEIKIINDSATIRVNGITYKLKVTTPYYTISGYAPVAVQMMLIKYWKQHGQPKTLSVLPKGKITIQFDGQDTIKLDTKKQLLDRYFISGLIWGKELLWTNQQGELITLFTNDAEGDKFEAIHEGYLELLPYFIGKAAYYGMRSMKVNQDRNSNAIIALKGGNLIDVINGNNILNSTILIKNGIIIKIGAADKIVIPKDAKIITISGKTVLPGLWDMHAHFQQVEWGPAYLATGITTVRDCGNEFDFINAVQQAIATNNGIGPTILKAGIIDGDGPMALGIVHANTPEEARAVVKKYTDSGFDQIKIYSSVKAEIIKAIADETHKQGLTLTGHVPEGVSLTEAIALGQDQINHFQYIHKAMRAAPKQKKINFTDSSAVKILTLLKKHNIVVDPTLALYEWIFRPLDQPLNAFEPGVDHISEVQKEIFQNTGLPPDKAKQEKEFLENGKALVLAMHRMGITIVAGTDMMIPGYSLYRELELYHEAGLSPIEAIRTATIIPAKVMKKDKQSGSINEGKNADLIILDANPLESMHNIRSVVKVIKGGVIYDPSELRKIIDFKN